MLAQPKRIALLLFLAVEGQRRPVPRDRLLALFWPESDEARARNTLSQSLHYLRQALGPDTIEGQGASLVGLRPGALWCDAVAFDEALQGDDPDGALALYHGDFAPALFVTGAPDVEQWLDAERRRLRDGARTAARRSAERLAQRGDRGGASRAARHALSLEPEDEGDVRALLALMDRMGDTTGALHAYDAFARRLADTLESEPSPETQRLVATIRSRRSDVPSHPSPAPVVAATLDALPLDGGPVAAVPAEPLELRPATSPIAAAPPRSPSRRLVATVAGLVAVIALAGAVTLGARERRGQERAVRTIAVLPFEMRAQAEPHHQFLRDGMVDLLSAKLDGVAGFHAIDPHSVIAAAAQDGIAVRDPAATARALGAGWFITGDAMTVAGRLQLRGALYDVRAPSQPIVRGTVVGDTASLLELVDNLTGRMLAGLLEGRDTVITRLAAVTTNSLPALRAFLEGERALREGRDAQAMAAFRSAAQLDTTFALAQFRLALASTWASVPGTGNPVVWAAAAMRHADRLTPLGRDLLAAYLAYKQLRLADAERIYRAVTLAHPDNLEAWFMLGETRFHYNAWSGRSSAEARPDFERALTLDPSHGHALVHLARLAAAEGDSVAVDSLKRRFEAGSRDASRTLELRALAAYVHDDPRERAAVAAAAVGADDYVIFSLMQASGIYAENLGAARELVAPFAATVREPWTRMAGRRMLSTAMLAQGESGREKAVQLAGPLLDDDWLLETEALMAAEPAFSWPLRRVAELRARLAAMPRYPGQARVLGAQQPLDLGAEMRTLLVALLDVRLGDTASAERGVTALMVPGDDARAVAARQLADGVRAALARERGDLTGALAAIERVPVGTMAAGEMSLAHWGVRERFTRAELLHALGRDDDALPVYASLQGYFDTPFAALSHLRRAQILARQGRHERAAFHYGRVLAMWHDADPALQPMVAEARCYRTTASTSTTSKTCHLPVAQSTPSEAKMVGAASSQSTMK